MGAIITTLHFQTQGLSLSIYQNNIHLRSFTVNKKNVSVLKLFQPPIGRIQINHQYLKTDIPFISSDLSDPVDVPEIRSEKLP